jgi:hypothetical protein
MLRQNLLGLSMYTLKNEGQEVKMALFQGKVQVKEGRA